MKDDIQWRNIDLNLLVTFSYLYRYRSVSLAAEKSFVSQSAMSHSLSRLRVLFDDPLFERKGHKMDPTEHAHHIAPTVHHLLDSIAKDLLTKSEFQPENYTGVCRIGLTDYAEFIFAPLLYDEIRKRAPEAQISFINVNRSNYVAITEHDKLDVILGSVHHLLDSIAKDLLTKSEFQPENYTGVCRIGLTDYAEFIFAPLLYDEIRKRAPEAQISFINVNRSNYVAITEHDKLDVILGSMPVLDDNFDSQYLYTEKHVCLCDKQVLNGETKLSIEAFANIEQALVSPDGSLSTQVDKKLAEHGLSRKVTVASRNFLTIRNLLKQRNLIAIVPEKMASAEGFSDGLVSVQPPIAVADFDIAMLWHTSRNNEDKGTWLRQLVADIVTSTHSR